MNALQALPACELPCTLGEGLLWDARGQRWCWTDIEQACIHTWAGPGCAPQRHALPNRLGSFAIAQSGRWLLGLSKTLTWGVWAGAVLRVTPICPVEADKPDTRINDGRTDRSGRFVFGTLHEATHRQLSAASTSIPAASACAGCGCQTRASPTASASARMAARCTSPTPPPA